MPTDNTVLPRDIDDTTEWLKANPKILKKSIDALKLVDLDLCDALALDPQLFLKLAGNTYNEAVAAKAPKRVLLTLKTRRNMTKGGLTHLPKFAYSWLAICQLRGVDSKAKARAILIKAASASPDKANQKILGLVAESIEARQDGGGSNRGLPCALCCAIGCLDCGLACIFCCVMACFICMIFT